jgi:hypothetical protein
MTIGLTEFRFLMMEMERGEVPEFAVTAMLPSALSVRPKGWGATSIDFPKGVTYLPLGSMVSPDLLIWVGKLPEGEETTFSFESIPWSQEWLKIKLKIKTETDFRTMTLNFNGMKIKFPDYIQVTKMSGCCGSF